MTVDKRVSKDPVQQQVPGQVQDPVSHLVDPLWSVCWGEHGEADVLQITQRVREESERSHSNGARYWDVGENYIAIFLKFTAPAEFSLK